MKIIKTASFKKLKKQAQSRTIVLDFNYDPRTKSLTFVGDANQKGAPLANAEIVVEETGEYMPYEPDNGSGGGVAGDGPLLLAENPYIEGLPVEAAIEIFKRHGIMDGQCISDSPIIPNDMLWDIVAKNDSQWDSPEDYAPEWEPDDF